MVHNNSIFSANNLKLTAVTFNASKLINRTSSAAQISAANSQKWKVSKQEAKGHSTRWTKDTKETTTRRIKVSAIKIKSSGKTKATSSTNKTKETINSKDATSTTEETATTDSKARSQISSNKRLIWMKTNMIKVTVQWITNTKETMIITGKTIKTIRIENEVIKETNKTIGNGRVRTRIIMNLESSSRTMRRGRVTREGDLQTTTRAILGIIVRMKISQIQNWEYKRTSIFPPP